MTTITKLLVGAIIAAGALALADNAAQPSTQPAGERITTDSGLTIVKVASVEAAAQPGDTVFVHYAGRLESTGAEFDNSFKRGEPIDFTLGSGQVIRGWDEGIAGMKIGEKRQLIIPPDLAYGARDRKNEAGETVIPANSTLVFDVELVGLVRR